ncbi:hypothetical protein [Microbacterium sp.]|uniref:hypothetical protein n=1 Tax=Microbacterium sp. TaxID=51671 RepID=UPI00092BA845|nr:hypothetical protein [Microbacterium sp.]MBN9193877.1 hypothetical protein [Microbacterium sp.]OJU70101.1 MAG: hypothetical protein BGO04_05285 [Microbacterium sp. 70-38]
MAVLGESATGAASESIEERRISGIFYASLVGAVGFAGLNIVNFQVHGVPFSPLYTGLVALVGVVPGLIAGIATYMLNRTLRVGAGARRGNGWNWVGGSLGAAVLCVTMLIFVPFYVTKPSAPLYIEILVASVLMLVFLALTAPGRATQVRVISG